MNRPSPRRRVCIGIAAGVGAFAASAGLAFTSARIGPEGVPIPKGPVLAPPQALLPGTKVDGIECQRGEQVALHIHAHLTIFVRGQAQQIPAGIGIAPPREVAATPRGAFVVGGTCFAWLHTHAADGIVHTESPVDRTYTLGEFFDIWGQPLTRERVGPARGRVTAYVGGHVYSGNPRRIRLLRHAQIQLDVGRPLVRPARIAFPTGL
jgi:hypothetical protein